MFNRYSTVSGIYNIKISNFEDQLLVFIVRFH